MNNDLKETNLESNLYNPNGVSKESAEETEALFQQSKYASTYYPKSLEGYWPELKNDYRQHVDDPAVYNLIKTILLF